MKFKSVDSPSWIHLPYGGTQSVEVRPRIFDTFTMEMTFIRLVFIRVQRVAFWNMISAMAYGNDKATVAYSMGNAWMVSHEAGVDILAVIAHAVVGYNEIGLFSFFERARVQIQLNSQIGCSKAGKIIKSYSGLLC